MPWIPMALSTIRPATSPRLSIIRLDFYSPINREVETTTTEMGNDLRRIADEITRIECEFGGSVTFTVTPDSKFRAALGTLNVSFSFVGRRNLPGRADSSSSLQPLQRHIR